MKAAGAAGLAVSIAGLVRTMQRAQQAYFDNERASLALSNAVSLTGRSAEISVSGIEQLASELSRTTRFAGAATTEAAALTQQLANLSENELRRAIPLIQDFAEATGTDLQRAARMVAATIDGSSSALTRYGIQIDRSGTDSERLESVLEQLNSRFGGTAEAIGLSAEAAGVQLKNAIDDLLALGGQVTSQFFAPVQRGTANMIRDFIESSEHARELREIMERGITTVGSDAGLQERREALASIREEISTLRAEEASLEEQIESVGGAQSAAASVSVVELEAVIEQIRRATVQEREHVAVIESRQEAAEREFENEQHRLAAIARMEADAEERERNAAEQREARNRAIEDQLQRILSIYGQTNEGQLAHLREQTAFLQHQSTVATKEYADQINISLEYLKEQETQLMINMGLIEGEAEAVEESVIVRTRLQDMISDERDRRAELASQQNAYMQAQERIAAIHSQGAGALAFTEELAILESISEALREQLGIEEQQIEQFDAWKIIAEEFEGVLWRAAEGAAGALRSGLEDVGKALAEGNLGADQFGNAISSAAQEITRQISITALGAGLRLLAEGGMAALPWAAALFGLAGLSAIGTGYLGGSSAGPVDGPAQKILSAEEKLARERIKLIDEQLKAERDMRRDNIRRMETEYRREFDVLKDMLDRNLMSHDEFRSEAGALADQHLTGVESEETAISEAEEQADAARDQADLDRKKAAKISAIESAIRDNQDILGDMNWWQKNVSQTGRRRELEDMITRLQGRLRNARSASTIEEVEAAKFGGSFETRGSALLRVGDNPGGRERIDVTPIGTPNRHGPSGGGIHIHVHGPVYGIDELHRQLQQAGRRLADRGVA
jgi:hypothetical protein